MFHLYIVTVLVALGLITTLAIKRKDVEYLLGDKKQLVRLLLIVLCPIGNVFYSLLAVPYFFSDHPYRKVR